MRKIWPAALGMMVAGCAAPPPAVVTPPPFTPAPVATRVTQATPPVGLAVAAGTATVTPQLVGDYATLLRPRLGHVQQGLRGIEERLAEVRQAPLRMAQDDWRAQMAATLDDLAAASQDVHALGARAGADAARYADVTRLLADVDFVVDEYRMAFDFDPDGSHLVRAGRAEATAVDEVESLLSDLRRPTSAAPTRIAAP